MLRVGDFGSIEAMNEWLDKRVGRNVCDKRVCPASINLSPLRRKKDAFAWLVHHCVADSVVRVTSLMVEGAAQAKIRHPV